MPSRRELFAINEDQIQNSLQRANNALLSRCREVIDDTEFGMPPVITSKQELHLANSLILELLAAQKQAREARLSDQKPFRNALKKIDEFYDKIEEDLKAEIQECLEIVAAALIEEESLTLLEDEDTVIAYDSREESIATASPSNTKPTSNARLEWAVKDIDQNTLDLEELRHHFTKTELKKACERFLKEEGPVEIDGLEYERKAVMP